MVYYVKNVVLPEGDGYRLAQAKNYQDRGADAYQRSLGWKAAYDKDQNDFHRDQQYFCTLESWMNYEVARQYMGMTDADH